MPPKVSPAAVASRVKKNNEDHKKKQFKPNTVVPEDEAENPEESAAVQDDVIVEQMMQMKRERLKLEMTPEEAALLVQRLWRGFLTRNRQGRLNMSQVVHIGYELKVMEERKKRKSLVSGFFQHIVYSAPPCPVPHAAHPRIPRPTSP